MIEIKGKFNTAKVFTNNLEEKAKEQILELCNQEFVKKSIIRIMPDTHAGAGCTIGTTMTVLDKVVPNLVGVDIGCGMYVSSLNEEAIDFEKLDKVIRNYVPSGFDVRKTPHEYVKLTGIEDLICKNHVDLKRAYLSTGTLGGGNHFIEMNQDDEKNIYLVVHSGSRNLGKQIAEYYQDRACNESKTGSRDLAFLQGESFSEYIHDMRIAQKFADYNRKAISEVIVSKMGFKVKRSFTTVHNYIDLHEMILRKGAISAKKNEVVIIPINMKDGSIIAIGKGNIDWNQSAPHGAGRIMSRKQAKRSLSIDEFKNTMKGVFTTTISMDTLDEAPAAYKPMEEIISNIGDTVEILKIIKPLYNFKASDD